MLKLSFPTKPWPEASSEAMVDEASALTSTTSTNRGCGILERDCLWTLCIPMTA